MNIYKLTLTIYSFVLLLMPWMKGGNAQGIFPYIFISIITICTLVHIYKGLISKNLKKVTFFIVLFIGSYTATSLVNPILKETDTENFKRNIQLAPLSNSEEKRALEEVLYDINESRDSGFASYLTLNVKNDIGYKFSLLSENTKKIIDRLLLSKSVSYIPYLPTTYGLNKEVIYNFSILLITIFSAVFIITRIDSNRTYKRLSLFVVINCFLLSLVGLMQQLGVLPGIKDKPLLGIWSVPDPRYFFSTFSYKNHWVAFSLLSIFHGIAVVFSKFQSRRSNRNWKTILPFCIIITFSSLTLFLIESRLAILSTVISLILLLPILLKIFGIKRVLPFLLFIPFVVLFTVDNQNDLLKRSAHQYQDFKDGNLPFRFLLWKDSYSQIQQKTFWGYGIDSYRVLNPIFQSSETVDARYVVTENAHRQFTPIIQNAHNDVFQFIIEHGFISCCLILFPICFITIREYLFSRNYYYRVIAAGCIVYLLNSFVDLPNKSLANMLMFSVTFCILLGYRHLSLEKIKH